MRVFALIFIMNYSKLSSISSYESGEVRNSFQFNQDAGCQTEIGYFPQYINDNLSLKRIQNLSPPSKTLELFYGWVDLEFELDKTKGICPIFDSNEALQNFKVRLYRKVYNSLVEQTQENSNSVSETIDFEI